MRFQVIISCMEYVGSYDCQADSEVEAVAKAKEAFGEKDWAWYGGDWLKPVVMNVDDPCYQYLNNAEMWKEGRLYKSGGYQYTSLYQEE